MQALEAALIRPFSLGLPCFLHELSVVSCSVVSCSVVSCSVVSCSVVSCSVVSQLAEGGSAFLQGVFRRRGAPWAGEAAPWAAPWAGEAAPARIPGCRTWR